jgi:hypothetical protein
MVAAPFMGLYGHFLEGAKRNTEKPVRIVNVPVEIRTGSLPNASMKRFRLYQLPEFYTTEECGGREDIGEEG